MRKVVEILILLIVTLPALTHATTPSFTVITKNTSQNQFSKSREDVGKLLQKTRHIKPTNQYASQIIQAAETYWNNRPYATKNAYGEGEWCNELGYANGCPHIQQDPILRTDAFNCTTYAQDVLALIGSHNLKQYLTNLTDINYGALDATNNVSFFNRNHFISSDFNPINEARGRLHKVRIRKLKRRWQHTFIKHKAWFKAQAENARHTVRVIHPQDGNRMVTRLKTYAKRLKFPNQLVRIDYIPLKELIDKTTHGYQANRTNIAKIPTPAIAEIVRNDAKWKLHGTKMISILHSGIAVSHLGFLFWQDYKHGAVIYQNIHCNLVQGKKSCFVTPRLCQRTGGCHELMFSQATDTFPDHYLFYQDRHGSYHCTATAPMTHQGTITTCNRVETLPLQDYLMRKNYGKYTVLETPSILGLHIEVINNMPAHKKKRHSKTTRHSS